MGVTNYTVLICTNALRLDTCNLWRALTIEESGEHYDNSPVELEASPRPGSGVHVRKMAATLNAVDPWTTTPTHWLGGGWLFPSGPTLVAQLKAGNVPSVDLLPYNLTQNRARTAAQALYSKTVQDDGTRETYLVAEDARAQALAETGLKFIPSQF